MKHRDSHAPGGCSIDDTAAAWVIRHDRGLTADEQDAFSLWLAADPRHRQAFAEQRWSWEELERLTGLQTSVGAVPDPRLLAPARRPAPFRWLKHAALPLAVAAAVLLLVNSPLPTRHEKDARAPDPALAPCEQHVLDDGSVVELNRGAAIAVAFSSAVRHVRLVRGEAHFSVTSDPTRPFVVEAAGVAVRAVGTAFSVAHVPGAVAVLVTEGKVQVAPKVVSAPGANSIVTAGQRAVVSLAPGAALPTITSVTAGEMEEQLAWKPRLLEFEEATLAEIAAEFNRRNPVKLAIPDPAVQRRRLSASIRSDNVEGFVKLLESDFGLRAERRGADGISLHAAR